MKRYYVCKNPTTHPKKHHEVHHEDCMVLPLVDKIDLGNHNSTSSAITSAKKYYTNVDGCIHCLSTEQKNKNTN